MDIENINKNQKHFTHNTSGSLSSSHNYNLMDTNSHAKNYNENENKEKDKNSNKIIKGTIKLDKIHDIIQNEDQKIFEDKKLQYLEPLEGSEDNSQNGDISYNKYLKRVNKELKGQDIKFINDLGLNNNLLNIKKIFDKIKKQTKFKKLKTQSSFSSLNKIVIKNKKGDDGGIIDIEENMYTYIKKEKENNNKYKNKGKREKNKLNISFIRKSLLSKNYINNEKRMMTYDNINTINNINKILDKEIILNTKEKKDNVRRINSGRVHKIDIRKKEKREHPPHNGEDDGGDNIENELYDHHDKEREKEDIFGNKRKKNIIQDPFNVLDDEEEEEIIPKVTTKDSKIKIIKIGGESKKDVIKKEEEVKKEEKKVEDVYIHPLQKLEENIKKMNMKRKKKKKASTKIEQSKEDKDKNKDKDKDKNKNKIKNKNLFLAKKNKIKNRETNSVKIDKNRSRLKSPAINSILNDISALSKLITTKIEKKRKKNKNNNNFDKHFGYEYWKENEYHQKTIKPLTSIKRGASSSYKSINSTMMPEDTNSMFSSNFSWLFKNKEKYFDIYNDNYTSKIKDELLNPYSVNWTKSILKNSYNRKIKLKRKISGIPEIELMSRSKSTISYLQPKVTYNIREFIDRKNNNLFKKSGNLYGRIYNNNEVEFPFIYKL